VSIVSSVDDISYDEGTAKGYDCIPEFMQRQYKQRQSLSFVYELLIEGQTQFRNEQDIAFPATTPSSNKNKAAPKGEVVLNQWHALAFGIVGLKRKYHIPLPM